MRNGVKLELFCRGGSLNNYVSVVENCPDESFHSLGDIFYFADSGGGKFFGKNCIEINVNYPFLGDN